MKKTIFILLSLMLAAAASAQITQISSAKLPGQARTTIRKAWNNAPIVDSWRNKDGRRIEYKASIEDGSVIKFAANGQWIEVKNYNGVPSSLLPAALVKYVNHYYEGRMIVWVIRKGKNYEVQLSDNTKLEFDPKGSFRAFL